MRGMQLGMDKKVTSFWTGAALGGLAVLGMIIAGLDTAWVLLVWLVVSAVGPFVHGN